jgi:hypothetical protein
MTLDETYCLICGAIFGGRTTYGLCPRCCHKDALREFDRWYSAVKQADRMNVPADLSLLQWMATISDHRGMCAFCQLMPHSVIEVMNPYQGLVWSNIVPACRSCSYIKRTGFGTVQKRIEEYLLANRDRSEEDISLEYHYESEDDEPYVPPLPEALKHSPIFKHMVEKDKPHD